MFALLVLMLLVVAIINFIIKKKEHNDEMKMTKQEVKEERKSKEVSEEVKSAKEKGDGDGNKQNLQDVSTADVVVTNPTHYAVALKYEKGTDNAPVVVAKGHDMIARRIKLIAKEFEVPMVEDKPVAQALCSWGCGTIHSCAALPGCSQNPRDVYKKHSYYFHRLKARRLLSRVDLRFACLMELLQKFLPFFPASREIQI